MDEKGHVSRSVESALRAALTPRYGGEIVMELRTFETANEPAQLFRLQDGYVLERCFDGCYVAKLGKPETTFLIDIDMIERAGDEWPDAYEIVRHHQDDAASERLMTADEADRLFDQEFPEVSAVLRKVPANMNEVGT